METHRDAIGNSVITPLRHVYIRNNMPTMSDAQIGNRNNWKLRVEGVKNPKTYTLAQLKQLAQVTETTILQCSEMEEVSLSISQEVLSGKLVLLLV